MIMWHYIYVLRDPRDNAIRYVGCSVRPEKRLYHHMNCWSSHKWAEYNKELEPSGLVPKLQVVDCIETTSAQDRKSATDLENTWIEHLFRLGCPLLNIPVLNQRPS